MKGPVPFAITQRQEKGAQRAAEQAQKGQLGWTLGGAGGGRPVTRKELSDPLAHP